GGAFAATLNFFTSSFTNGDLMAPGGNNGVYGSSGAFPTSSYASANYFRDVVFVPNNTPPDTTPPTVNLTSPPAGNLAGALPRAGGNVWDTGAGAGVQFGVDGTPRGGEVPPPPYQVNWDSTLVSNGPHTLKAVARDTSNNLSTPSTVSVTVNNSSNPSQTLLT